MGRSTVSARQGAGAVRIPIKCSFIDQNDQNVAKMFHIVNIVDRGFMYHLIVSRSTIVIVLYAKHIDYDEDRRT
jgi:hypothetical protein